MWYSLVMKETWAGFNPVNVNIPICFMMWLQSPGVPVTWFERVFVRHGGLNRPDQSIRPYLPRARNASKSCFLMLMIRSAMALSSRVHSLNKFLSRRITATIDAPWIGGLEYIGLITSFSWLSTLPATSAALHTYNNFFLSEFHWRTSSEFLKLISCNATISYNAESSNSFSIKSHVLRIALSNEAFSAISNKHPNRFRICIQTSTCKALQCKKRNKY